MRKFIRALRQQCNACHMQNSKTYNFTVPLHSIVLPYADHVRAASDYGNNTMNTDESRATGFQLNINCNFVLKYLSRHCMHGVSTNVRTTYVVAERLDAKTPTQDTKECVITQKWTILQNTKVQSGRSNDSPSVTACQSSCIATQGCNGFDWSPDFKIGQRCWLSGTWSTEWNNGTAVGVTHFVLTLGCESDSIQQASSSGKTT